MATARILDISVPGQLGTWTLRYWLGHLGTRYWTFRYWPGHPGTRYWTVWDLDETIFGTDHNCLVLINWQYFCTSSSMTQKWIDMCFWYFQCRSTPDIVVFVYWFLFIFSLFWPPFIIYKSNYANYEIQHLC
jgi:hypothetical protein